jgi:hypothetical protein
MRIHTYLVKVEDGLVVRAGLPGQRRADKEEAAWGNSRIGIKNG